MLWLFGNSRNRLQTQAIERRPKARGRNGGNHGAASGIAQAMVSSTNASDGMQLERKIDLLREAILHHRQVTAIYDGRDRAFCPHFLGTHGGGWNVLGWRFAGHSDKGLPAGGAWRCFELARLRDMALRDGNWHRGIYEGFAQHCVSEVDTAIDAAHGAVVRRTRR